MADPPPKRKRPLAAAEPESSPDGLAALPDDVLDNILGRLHIYEVARTSALSRAWRRRWESLPSVDLTRSPGIAASDVDSVLLRRSAPVRAFRLIARDPSWFVDAFHDWLLYLSRNGVQTLDLDFLLPNFQLHSCVFSCRELTCLDLGNCRLPPAPTGFVGFPNLKKLHLCRVSIAEHGGKPGLAPLIAASPLLEEAKLISVQLIGDGPDEEWVIRAPNLRNLTIVSEFPSGGRVEDLPRLEEVIICGPNYAKFLRGMAHLTKLQFLCNFMLSTEVDVLDQLPFLFENLRSLVLGVNFSKMSHILFMFCLLRSAPVLEELDILGWDNEVQDINANAEFLNAQWTNHMFAKLRVVRMKKAACICNAMYFMEFVLAKARVLQVLSVHRSSGASDINENTVIAKYPRASPGAQVVFVDKESENNGFIDSSIEKPELETRRTGTWIDVSNPRKIHRLDLQAVPQLEDLQEELLISLKSEIGRHRHLNWVRGERIRMRSFYTRFQEYVLSTVKSLHEQHNVPLPPIPEPSAAPSSSHPASSRSTDTGSDHVISGDGNEHADSSADHVANAAANVHAKSPEHV